LEKADVKGQNLQSVVPDTADVDVMPFGASKALATACA
jgi:hypothetical protein